MTTEAQAIGLLIFIVMLVFLILAVGVISQYHQMTVSSDRIQAEANEGIARVRS